MIRICLLQLFVFLSALVFAGPGEYMSQQDFLSKNLGAQANSHVLWFSKDLREELKRDLKYMPSGARIRYWSIEGKRAWIAEEIGRDKPITMGFIIEHGEIVSFEVLVFRESRGYEIRYPRFSRQLESLSLDDKFELTNHVDNITGATLSVNAVKKMARFVLYLDEYVARQ